ncbi:hypothetical protein ABBQ38_002832 [Trebouxia sp. C0009 RCD-2024]
MPHATFQRGPCTSTTRAHTATWSPAICHKTFRGLRDAKIGRKRAQGTDRRTSSRVLAAASPAETTDLKQIFKDALSTSPIQNDSPTSSTPAPTASEGLLGQTGSAADGINTQAQSSAQAVQSQAAPAAEALKTQAQSLAASKAESISQGLSSGNAADSARDQLQSQLKSGIDRVPDTGNSPGEAVNAIVQQANEATSKAIQSAQDAPGALLDGINQTVPGLQSSVDSAAAAFSSQVNDAASSVMDALPAPAAEALQAAASAIQPGADRLWGYVNSDPKAGAAAAGLAVGLPLLTYWRARLSGYSGQLQPKKALDLLNKSNTLLVDIRREEVRNRDGIPLLKRGSRGKGAAFPLQSVSVPPAVVRSSKQGQNLRLQVAALQILGLKQVKRGTKLVLLDRTGGADAITLARNIRQVSRRKVYIVAGGFSAWEKQGLGTQDTATNYQSTVLDSLADEAETLVESATSFVRDPVLAVGAFGGVALAGVALVDWHYALKYVGILGAQLTLINWLRSYDSPQVCLLHPAQVWLASSGRVAFTDGRVAY